MKFSMGKKVVRDGITFSKSPNKAKKYRAELPDGRSVDFGARGYEHYHDKIGLYSSLDHGDKKRRAAYRKRHGAIRAGGEVAHRKKYSPAWFSWRYLW